METASLIRAARVFRSLGEGVIYSVVSVSPSSVPTETVARARASYTRCLAAPDFFSCFYRNFFMECPEVEERFATTDFQRQHKLLQHAIGLLLSYATQVRETPNLLERIATRHNRNGLNVDPKWYPCFVDTLVTTVKEHDPDFDDAVGAAWRSAVAPGIAFMRASY